MKINKFIWINSLAICLILPIVDNDWLGEFGFFNEINREIPKPQLVEIFDGENYFKCLNRKNYELHYSVNGIRYISNNDFNKIEINAPLKSEISFIPSSPRWKRPGPSQPNGYKIEAFFVDTKSGDKGKNTRFFIPDFKTIKKSNLPIVSVQTKVDHLFGFENGIYHRGSAELYGQTDRQKWWFLSGNYHGRGKDWARKGHVDLFFLDTSVIRRSVKLKINGNATRAFPQKSLRLKFKDPVHSGVFGTDENYSIQEVVLRNGGNDWDKGFIRDYFVQTICEELNFENQNARPVVVFVNGEYWGIHFLYEKLNDKYLENKFHLDTSEYIIVEDNGLDSDGNPALFDEYMELKNKLAEGPVGDLTLRKTLMNQFDVNSLFDYLIIQIFIANTDWPNHNIKIWKAPKLHNKYRFMLYDTDYGLGFAMSNQFEKNMFEHLGNGGSFMGQMLRLILKDKELSTVFESRMNYLLENDLSTAVLNEKCTRIKEELINEMPNHINRWRTHDSVEEWEEELGVINEFIQKREHFVRDHYAEYYKKLNP